MKTAVINGADGDMGQQLALFLAKSQYNIIMACHSQNKGNAACEKLRNLSRWEHINVMQVDLSSLTSIQQFCNTVKNQYSHIDILLNNAGVLPSHAQVSADGYEKTVAVNYLGLFLFTELLSPLFHSGTKIVNMVSLTYKYGKINGHFFMPDPHKKYNRFSCYSNSKLGLFYATLYWAEKWKNKGITVNCADPGIVNTNIIRMDNKIIDTLCDIFFRPLIRTPKQGADTMAYVALNEISNTVTGQLFHNRKIKKIKKSILDNPQRTLLIEQTENLLKNYL
ncbi:MAG: SDR family NAD(P)-dependent oxidoreductase [Bacteroidales bacterium]|nr:SDR family NAD(P)-dependent oxidoreductase [Bacteroidales bacterium]